MTSTPATTRPSRARLQRAKPEPASAPATRDGLSENVRRQFDKAADHMGLDPSIRRILSHTMNEVVVNFPVRMDDGQIRIFTGYRVQHNNALGPFKGGMRFHPNVNIDEVRALAAWMSWKTAIAELPFGGAKGGLQVDTSEVSPAELERITRRFTFALGSTIGPDYDIPAPDVNTNPQIMAWMLDTYLSTVPPQERQRCLQVVTGKPIQSGGSRGRDQATGQGVVFCIERWAMDHNVSLNGASYFIQGFGNVGSWAARLMQEHGARLLAVQDHTGAIANPDGIDATDLVRHVEANGGLLGYQRAKPVSRASFLRTRADIFIPAALENQVNGATAERLIVRLVAEGANGPVDPDGDVVLARRGIDVLPDILCNAGGVIVSYFEWLQNKRSESWDLDDVQRQLRKKILKAYDRVSATAAEQSVDFRTAAYIVALKHLEGTYREHGIFP